MEAAKTPMSETVLSGEDQQALLDCCTLWEKALVARNAKRSDEQWFDALGQALADACRRFGIPPHP